MGDAVTISSPAKNHARTVGNSIKGQNPKKELRTSENHSGRAQSILGIEKGLKILETPHHTYQVPIGTPLVD